MQDKLPLWRRMLKGSLMTLLTAVLLLAFYLAVVMGDPQPDGNSAIQPRQDQPLLPAMSSPVLITQQSQLGVLLDAFPAPALATMNTTTLIFQQGLCEDVPFEDGLGRRMTLSYTTADGAPVTVTSIYPARSLSLLEKGELTISATAGLPLAGLRSVRMEKPGTIRLHAQGTDALYVVTLPELSPSALRSLTSTLQLYQGE